MGKLNALKRPGKKGLAVIAVMIFIISAGIAVFCFMDNQKTVDFTVLSESKIPQEITSDVIPEYRALERALACLVDDKVYVVVTRGEKPASGYKVDIRKMKLENDNEKETLIVYADFTDPDRDSSVSQVITYPVKVAETELKKLPDDLELRVQYLE